MSIFDINFSDKIPELLPPDKRSRAFVEWLRALTYPLLFLYKKFIQDYRVGDAYVPYSSSYTYVVGNIVYYEGKTYINKLGSTNIYPLNITYWDVYLPSQYGTDTRLTFTAQTLNLEHNANIRFNTAYRQPPLQSDIYITDVAATAQGFLVGQTELFSSTSGQTLSSKTIGNVATFGKTHSFDLNVPTASNTPQLRPYIDNFIAEGTTYIVVPY